MEVGGNTGHAEPTNGKISPVDAVRAKKEKEGQPSITTGSAREANKDVGWTVFTFNDSFHEESSSLPGRKEQLTETSQLWANLSPHQAALSCQLGPASPSPLSPALQLPGVPQCHPQPWKRHAVGSPRAALLSDPSLRRAFASPAHKSHSRRPAVHSVAWGPHRPHGSVLLPPTPTWPCCTDSCPLVLSSCLNPTKCLSKCPES